MPTAASAALRAAVHDALVVWQVLSAWLIASGLITEMLRRRNAGDLR